MNYTDQHKCKCGRVKNLELEPTLKTLIFGPSPGSFYFGTQDHPQMAYICPRCSKSNKKKIERILNKI